MLLNMNLNPFLKLFNTCSVLLICVAIFKWYDEAFCFNVDLPSRVVHSSPQQDDWFGYSVALYKHEGVNTLLVGAPKYNTTQPNVVRGGAVLRCSTENSAIGCQYVPFDNKGHSKLDQLDYYIDSKSDQLFGATIESKNGIVVACAPRYVWYTSSRRRREPVGTCYVARQGLTDFQEYSPCRTEKWGYHRQGSCQAGFDAALSDNGSRMYIGAPGAYYWQGQIHSQSLVVRNEYNTTGEGPAIDDDQYLGYSVAAGDFNGDGVQDIALGVPKGLNYTGKVSLYSHDLQWLQNITGDQLGSYFGYCLTVLDFNGDSLDDIVVGAPLYTDFEDREMKIEIGKVHVLIQDTSHFFRTEVEYLGDVHRGRFGLSVASLGDINLDNYQDFAVGAPYSGIDARGAVFIYHGFSLDEQAVSRDVMQKPVQVIYASDVGNRLSTFGWSLSGGVDIDGNQYPDMMVGAYEVGRAFLFKSRPIIKFRKHKLTFKTEGKAVDLDAKNCKIKGTKSHVCLDLEFCLAFTGINVLDRIELEILYRLDTKQSSEQRLLFETNDQPILKEKIQYTKEVVRCRTLRSYLKLNIVDKLTPIAANVSYSLIERRQFSGGPLTPVLDRDQRLSMQDSLAIQKNCGPDNVCIPDLVLTFDAPDEFIIGQKEMLNVSVEVENRGEDAFESVVFISEPPGLLFNKFEPRVNISCSTRKIDNRNFVKCDIGNPLPKHQMTSFTVFFQQSGLLEKPEFDFEVSVNCSNSEDGTYGNNVARKIVAARVDARLTLFGSSEPESIIYNTTLYQVPLRESEEHFGPSLVHKYGLLSKGPSAVQDAEIMILWPSRTLSGDHLLYLMEQPITVGNVQCEHVPDVNPLNLKVISKEERIRTLRLTSLEEGSQIFSSSSSSSGSSVTYTGSSSTSFSNKGSSFHSEGGSYYGSSSSSQGSTQYGSSSSSSGSSSGYYGSSSSNIGTGGGIYQGSGTSSGSGSQYYGSSSSSGSGSQYSGSGTLGGSSGGYYGSGSSGNSYYSSVSSSGGGSDNYHGSGVENGRSVPHGNYGSSGYYSSSHGRNYSSTSLGGEGTSGGYSQYGSNTYSYSSQGLGGRGGYKSSFVDSHSSGTGSQNTTFGSSNTYSHPYSTGHGNLHTTTELSNQGRQSHLLLPSAGSDGKFAATMFTVSGGGSSNRNDGHSGVTSSNAFGDNQLSSGSSQTYSSHSESGGGYLAPQYDSQGWYSSSGGQYSNSGQYSSSGGTSYYPGSQTADQYHSSSRDESDNARRTQYSSHYEQKPYETRESSYSYQQYSSGSTDDDGSFYPNEIHSRAKRDAEAEEKWERLVSECGATLCTRIRCRTGSLTPNDDVYIYVRSRLWVDTLSKFQFPVDDVTISTRMAVRANVKPQGVATNNIEIHSKEVVTPIRSAKSLAEARPVPWWVILLATLAGVLILLLIILVLWKCGYFQRHRPRHKACLSEDSRPLNPPQGFTNGRSSTNGVNGMHHHSRQHPRLLYPGDEAL